ncbi:MAG: TAXI family TRAP transporter solute-binding subunit [Actinobacteria bacterium]|nr:TAXI family TRAP transporter solute-binding subunit [Actinomycetota bacterium]
MSERNADRFFSTRTVKALLSVMFVLLLTACGGPAEVEEAAETGQAEAPATDSAEAGGVEGEVASRASIGTHSVGQSYHTVGSAVASLISSHTDIAASVVPSAGPNAWMPDLEAGVIDFGVLSSVDVGWAMEAGPGFNEPAENMRMVLQGAPVLGAGFAVRADSGIATIADLVGKRVASDYGGNVIAGKILEANLASVGMTWDDVVEFPVPDISTGADALRGGQVDGMFGASPATAIIQDLDAAVPLRILPIGDYEPADIADEVPADAQAMLDEILPGATLGIEEAGTGMLEEDTVMVEHRVTFVSSDRVSPATVHATLAAIWENYEELQDAHIMAQWVPDDMVPAAPRAPYHEGAVAFYEEQGVWTEEHQAAQDELLASMPQG